MDFLPASDPGGCKLLRVGASQLGGALDLNESRGAASMAREPHPEPVACRDKERRDGQRRHEDWG